MTTIYSKGRCVNVNGTCRGRGTLCEHFPRICPACYTVVKERWNYNVYYTQCFYCLLSGAKDLAYNADSWEDRPVRRGHTASLIGRRDGLEGKEMPMMGCYAKILETLYTFAYRVGMNERLFRLRLNMPSEYRTHCDYKEFQKRNLLKISQ